MSVQGLLIRETQELRSGEGYGEIPILEFAKRELLAAINSRRHRFASPNELSITRARLVTQLRWFEQGLNVIRPTASLCASVLLTDVSGEIERAKLPYDGLLFEVPRGFLVSGREHYTSMLCGYGAFDDGAPGYTVFLFQPDSAVDEATGQGLPILRGFVREHELMEQGFAGVARRWSDEKVPDQGMVDVLARAWHLLIGLSLYIGMTKDCEQRRDRRKERLRSRDLGRDWPSEWVSGRGVTISPELKLAALGKPGETRQGWTLRTQHVVRGHWRNQACGAGRSDRRMTWIRPHMRGPEGEAAWSHVYEVK